VPGAGAHHAAAGTDADTGGGAHLRWWLVDYAHTPDALDKVLATLREIVGGGRLICVFGCGGNRDRGKRPLMGEAVARGADEIWVTSDNPRNEDPRHIIDDILAGIAGKPHVEPDRARAIFEAIGNAHQGDVVADRRQGARGLSGDRRRAAAVLRRGGREEGAGGMGMSMMRLSEATAMLGVPFAGADADVLRVSTDSRSIQPGDLFIALRGEKFDGGAFAAQALQQGAAGVVLDATQAPGIASAIRVDDTRLALGRLAAAWRQRFAIPVVAVTRSNGKTTVKEMLAAILRAETGSEAAVLCTEGNLKTTSACR